jgi:hypothetical protein
MGKVAGKDYQVGKFPFSAAGKAIAARNTDGFVKIIRGLPRGEILGAHIMGDQATELIGELGLARRLEATSEELHRHCVHAHPTLQRGGHGSRRRRGKPRDPHLTRAVLNDDTRQKAASSRGCLLLFQAAWRDCRKQHKEAQKDWIELPGSLGGS